MYVCGSVDVETGCRSRVEVEAGWSRSWESIQSRYKVEMYLVLRTS